jgi:hypothetical protein
MICAKTGLPVFMTSVRCAMEDYSHPTDKVQIETREKRNMLQFSQIVTRVRTDNVGTLPILSEKPKD